MISDDIVRAKKTSNPLVIDAVNNEGKALFSIGSPL